jgi:beta-lactamase class A
MKNTLLLYIKKIWVGIVLGIVAGGILVWIALPGSSGTVTQTTEVRADSNQYAFINPIFFYKNQADKELDYVKDKISKYIKNAEDAGNAEDISVYYRDMNSGRWTGVNEQETYVPASMLKVVYMMSFLKRAEDDPKILLKKLYYNAADRDVATFDKADDGLKSGYYSVNDLINYMIIYSDNAALKALATEDGDRAGIVFDLFQLPRQSTSSTTPDFMSVRTYSRIFRVLYDSTFLSWNLSEQALKVLSRTRYSDGIQSGVPGGTVVSHKFGERTNIDQNGKIVNRELHDCGIVYSGKKPYFICVMTRGQDFLTLQKIIQDVSSLVHDEISIKTE